MPFFEPFVDQPCSVDTRAACESSMRDAFLIPGVGWVEELARPHAFDNERISISPNPLDGPDSHYTNYPSINALFADLWALANYNHLWGCELADRAAGHEPACVQWSGISS